MKNHRFLQLVVILVLMVTAVSCTAIREGYGYGDDQYESRSSRYYGNRDAYGNNVIIVERDPYTGRYYEVSPYSSYYGSRMYPYRSYNYGYDRNYPNYNTTPRQYNGSPRQTQPQPQTQDRQKMNEARERVLGGRN
ncbi:MAG: hypothetical protein M3342_01465 [Bacteroidota bacterium]|nr:hypothetical protein [Bacteroidota bacterium]